MAAQQENHSTPTLLRFYYGLDDPTEIPRREYVREAGEEGGKRPIRLGRRSQQLWVNLVAPAANRDRGHSAQVRLPIPHD
jgi:hypothetical protein